jgi:hypothetical protein
MRITKTEMQNEFDVTVKNPSLLRGTSERIAGLIDRDDLKPSTIL